MSAPPDLMIAQVFLNELGDTLDTFNVDAGADPELVAAALYLAHSIVSGRWTDLTYSTDEVADFFKARDCWPLIAPYTVESEHTAIELQEIKATWLMTRRMDGKPVEHLSLPHWEHL